MNNINLELLKKFYYVANNKSITKTAEQLYVSQPAITQAIKKLEDELSTTLFIRTENGITLTNDGEKLYKYISSSMHILENTSEVLKEYSNLSEGNLVIRTGSELLKTLLTDTIFEYIKDFPNIKFDIRTDKPEKSIDDLSKGKVDIVTIYLPYETDKQDIEIYKCISTVDCFCASKEFLKDKKIETYQDLNKYNIIVPIKASSRAIGLENFLKDNNIKLNIKYEIAGSKDIMFFIKNNIGIGFINRDSIIEDIENGSIVELKLTPEIKERYLGFAVQSANNMSYAAKEFVKRLKEKFKCEKI